MNHCQPAQHGEPGDPPKVPSPALLKISETDPEVAIGTCQELDRTLHKTQLRCAPNHSLVVTLYVHGHRLEIGLGLPQSFVTIQRCDPTPGPILISSGNARANWGVVFFFRGWHRVEVPERNLLPAGTARQILREFFETGLRSNNIEWEAL